MTFSSPPTAAKGTGASRPASLDDKARAAAALFSACFGRPGDRRFAPRHRLVSTRRAACANRDPVGRCDRRGIRAHAPRRRALTQTASCTRHCAVAGWALRSRRGCRDGDRSGRRALAPRGVVFRRPRSLHWFTHAYRRHAGQTRVCRHLRHHGANLECRRAGRARQRDADLETKKPRRTQRSQRKHFSLRSLRSLRFFLRASRRPVCGA